MLNSCAIGSIGLSATEPTVQFDLHQIHIIDDLKATETGEPLTDGCGSISLTAMKEVRNCLGLDYTPIAIQGRIGAAKGLWILRPPTQNEFGEDRHIWLSQSQIKFDCHLEDPDQRVLEVLAISKAPKAGSLNNQLIQVLHHNGVPNSVLANVVLANIDEQIKGLPDALKDGVSTIRWLIANNLQILTLEERQLRGRDICQFPRLLGEKIRFLIEAGRNPSTCPMLASLLKEIPEKVLSRFGGEKFHIQVPKSTYVFCVPDLTRTLGPGEVYLRFSDRYAGEEWERPRTVVGEVLVGRNPAYTSSDVQKVLAIDHPDLEEWGVTDVIVFSTNEKIRSLASLLSGGDFDGDKIWVFWDPEIVGPYKAKPESIPNIEEFLDLDGKVTVSDVVDKLCIYNAAHHQIIQHQLYRSLQQSLTGIASSLFDEVSYRKSIDHPFAKTLAAVANASLDAPKQGYTIDSMKWGELKADAEKLTKRKKPAYKQLSNQVALAKTFKHPLDFLRFNIALKRVRELTGVVELMFGSRALFMDAESHDCLENLFRTHFGGYQETVSPLYTKVSKTPGGEVALDNLDIPKIKTMLGEDFDEAIGPLVKKRVYLSMLQEFLVLEDIWRKWFKEQPQEIADVVWQADFTALMERITNRYRAIVPDPKASEVCPFVREAWASDTNSMSQWGLVRASALYSRSRGVLDRCKLAWIVAGQELAHLNLKWRCEKTGQT